MKEILLAYQSKGLCEDLARQIFREANTNVRFMEVCGGHTLSIRKHGIPSLLPPRIKLLSGPGCPVCVTGREFIDQAVFLSKQPDITVCTYGDLLKVPGSFGNLEQTRARGGRVRVVLSSLQALSWAETHPRENTVFLGIGFETTAPGTAAAILTARKRKVKNFFVLSAHKVMAPAMEAIAGQGIPINGYICPGHVCAITGSAPYARIVKKFGIGCVISGFEPLDLMQSIWMLVLQNNKQKPAVEIQYSRVVKPEGNKTAQALMNKVFKLVDTRWRGLGIVEQSGLMPRQTFSRYDASIAFSLPGQHAIEPEGCICGDILKGIKEPSDCRLFGTACNPDHPVGACMVSGEGACQTHYHYAGTN